MSAFGSDVAGGTMRRRTLLDGFTWFRQSAFRWSDGARTIYIDPWGTSKEEPAADVVFITHAHSDHLQPVEIERLRTDRSKLVAPRDVARELSGDVTAVAPGESHEVAGVRFSTVPAYNVVEHRLDAHPKTNGWVGYVMELAGRTYYHAGDTDHLPELEEVDANVTLVPIGGDPFTMDPDEAGALVRAIQPSLAVPMHFGFVVGAPSDGERFRRAADPVPVEVLTPTNPFEREG
jgi:L-ascorbate metabolism protein UlaG (beta-lactamase superfamily)